MIIWEPWKNLLRRRRKHENRKGPQTKGHQSLYNKIPSLLMKYQTNGTSLVNLAPLSRSWRKRAKKLTVLEEQRRKFPLAASCKAKCKFLNKPSEFWKLRFKAEWNDDGNFEDFRIFGSFGMNDPFGKMSPVLPLLSKPGQDWQIG